MELNHIRPHGRKCNLKTHVQNLGYPLPLQIGGPETTFYGRLRNSTATLPTHIFGMKHDIHKQASALQTTRVLLHCLKTTWTLVYKPLQIGSEFSHTLHKFCIPLHCQAYQTEISKRNSTKLCQMVGGTSCWQSAAEKLGRPFRKTMGAIKLLHSFGFYTTSRLNGKYLLKLDVDNQARVLESMKGLIHCPKISWTLVHKWLKTAPEFLPTLTILFRPSPSHTFYPASTWRPIATLNETALDSPAAQVWSPRRCHAGNAIALGGLKWQYIAIIATFSSLISNVVILV